MESSKTPLRLKLKLGNGGSLTPEPAAPAPVVASKMTEEEGDLVASEEEADFEDDWQEDPQGDELGGDDDEEMPHSRPQQVSHEDATRERHKKSKKKKKKKEREKERHKHKHHKERTEVDEDEPPTKKMATHQLPQERVTSKASLAAFKELLEVLLQHLQKKDPQQFFSFPVTDAIAPGYSSIISSPMDFSKIQAKIQEGAYSKLSTLEEDFRLICNNCMIYNQPDTVYYKAAKKLLHAGEKILSEERILPLKKEMSSLLLLSKEQLGFDINAEIPIVEHEEGSQDSNKLSDNESSQDQVSKFESLQDDLSAEEILEQAQKAAEEAADKLTQKKPVSTLGFLRQRVDGTTTLNFLTGCEGNDPSGQKEKPVSLGILTGKLTQGSSTLHNYRDDKRSSMAKPVKPLYYGSFSSFCPSYDSTFANLNKEESEMVYATYGNETAVQYAESICDFSRDCDMAMHLVDQLLNLLTHQQHSRTKAFIDDRRKVQHEEHKLQSLLYSVQEEHNSRQQHREITPNFTTLRTLKDLGIDTSFLSAFERIEQREKIVGSKLNENATLLSSLAKEQRDRLSKPLPQNLNDLPPPSQTEVKLAEKVTEGLISVARQIPPGALAPVPIVRRALGITMMPVSSDSSEQIEVDIEETSSQESVLSPAFASVKQCSGESDNLQSNPAVLPNSANITDRNLKEMLSG